MAALTNMSNLFRSSRGSGVLNLQGRELKEVPREVIKPFDSLAADEKAFAVVLLSRLNLNDNELQSLPEVCTRRHCHRCDHHHHYRHRHHRRRHHHHGRHRHRHRTATSSSSTTATTTTTTAATAAQYPTHHS